MEHFTTSNTQNIKSRFQMSPTVKLYGTVETKKIKLNCSNGIKLHKWRAMEDSVSNCIIVIHFRINLTISLLLWLSVVHKKKSFFFWSLAVAQSIPQMHRFLYLIILRNFEIFSLKINDAISLFRSVFTYTISTFIQVCFVFFVNFHNLTMV